MIHGARFIMAAGALAFALALTGCGELTAGGFGEVRVFMDSDEGGPNGIATPAALERSAARPEATALAQSPGQTGFEGVIEVVLQVFVRNDTGDWIELTNGPQEVVVDAGGGSRVELARRPLETGEYDRTRLEFSHIEAEITSGPPGQQLPPDGRIFVDFEGTLDVERGIHLPVQVDDVVEVTIDLRAGSWLRSAALDRVIPVMFRNALRIRVD